VRRLIAILVVLAAVLIPAVAAAAPTRTITLSNNTGQTIWPAASPGSTSGQTGWTLKPGAEVSFQVSHDWDARLWGRTGCHFGGGEGSCRTGDCDGRYQCEGWGAIPATLGEFNFDAYKGLDFYDISMVDGSNLPMYATPSGGEASRKVDADGCLDPFAAGCSPAKTWPVDYAKVFKRAEPYAYSWSGDDATSVFTCKGNCDYRITFGVTPPRDRADAARAAPSPAFTNATTFPSRRSRKPPSRRPAGMDTR
jgi:hypothetical protein